MLDVIVADIGLPREDGLWLIEQVRGLPRVEHRTLPAVALTAFTSGRDRQNALAAGYDDQVPKPLVDALVGAIRRPRARKSDASGEPLA